VDDCPCVHVFVCVCACVFARVCVCACVYVYSCVCRCLSDESKRTLYFATEVDVSNPFTNVSGTGLGIVPSNQSIIEKYIIKLRGVYSCVI